ncbi:hypothetical protein PAXRUDRAFT_831170 [Paxillus rubicundulus Ve08.2h10]|uniref:Uncharacterized protein n=1 Tax=Paxillus rubicundulus Ve08.2h10 TaxID=930991 RepID=A0A0D0E2K7_9AGAM|nr:hypothetical protein PAXRUDRAFT_831170 [Paxillus rubicundulus Ve08.2h10]
MAEIPGNHGTGSACYHVFAACTTVAATRQVPQLYIKERVPPPPPPPIDLLIDSSQESYLFSIPHDNSDFASSTNQLCILAHAQSTCSRHHLACRLLTSDCHITCVPPYASAIFLYS